MSITSVWETEWTAQSLFRPPGTVANLRPIIDAVIDDYKVDLYSVEELKDVPKVT